MKSRHVLRSGRPHLLCLSLCCCALLALASIASVAGELALDPSPAITMRSRENMLIWDLRALDGGQLLVAGQFDYVDGLLRPRFARLQEDGSLNPASPLVTADIAPFQAYPVSGGRTIIGGWFPSSGAASRPGLARVLPDGSIDPSFVPDPVEVAANFRILPAPGDAFFLAGYYNDSTTGMSRTLVRRYLADGHYDPGFPLIDFDAYPVSWAIGPGGELVVITSARDIWGNSIARRFDGSGQEVVLELPHDFDPRGAVFDGSGSLVFAGQSMATGRMLVRILPDGTTDGLFSGLPPAPELVGESVVCLSGGEFVVQCVPAWGQGTTMLVHFSASGFSQGTVSLITTGNPYYLVVGLASLPDGDYAAYGTFDTANGVVAPNVAKVGPDGQVRAFSADLIARGSVSAIAPFAGTGKLLAGSFTEIGSADVLNAAALNSDGSTGPTLPMFPGGVWEAFGTADGGAVLIGSYQPLAGTGTTGLTKLLPDGSIDTNFLSGRWIYGFFCGAGMPDGSVILGGYMGLYDPSVGATNLMRVGADGQMDYSFVQPDLLGDGFVIVSALAADSDRILIGGSFTSAQGQARPGIARFLANGVLDTLFAPAVGLNTSMQVPLQAKMCGSGEVYVIGIRADDPANTRQLIRFNYDGSLDETFAVAVQDLGITAYVPEPDGTLLVAMQSTNGSAPELVRLTHSGSIDPSFHAIADAGGYVGAIALDPNARLWVGGSFTQINGQPREGLATFSPVVFGVQIEGAAVREVPLLESVTLQAQVVGAGGPVHYQWFRDGRAIRKAHGDSLTLNHVKPNDSGSYTVIASDTTSTVTSEPVTVSVKLPPRG